MRVDYFPKRTLMNFHREIDLLLLDYSFAFDTSLETTMSNRRMSERDMGKMHGACYPQDPFHTEDLTGIPVNTLPDRKSPGFHSYLDFAPIHPELVSSYLAPEGFFSSQQGVSTSDAAGSAYEWSNSSIVDLLKPPVLPLEPAVGGVFELGPSMQHYHGHRPSQPQLQNALGYDGYDHQPSNKWCMGSIPRETTGNLYYHTASLLGMDPLSFSAAEMSSGTYPAFEENQNTLSRKLLSRRQSSDALIPHTESLTPESFFTPSSAPTGSCDTFSMPSHSPAPSALSDNELWPSSHQRLSLRSNADHLAQYGIPTADGAWRCAHPGCTSQAHFHRGCDLRKHFNRHRKYLFCRQSGCPQSRRGGFSSKKDRDRHESKHNPGVVCDWEGCARVFSRVDNMKDHVRRIHRRGDQ